MIFNPNQTKFENNNQRDVWKYGINIVPPEVSLADVEDEEIREGCMQIYDCTMEILAYTWNNPDECEGNVNGYAVVYISWILSGIKSAPFKRDVEAFSRYIQKISLFGFVYNEDLCAWTNDRYPLFCEYYPRFVELAKKRKQNMGGYLQRLDFRLFAKRIIITFDDLLRPLSDTEKTYFLELHEYALAKRMKVKKKEVSHFGYTYNDFNSLGLNNNPASVYVSFGLNYASDQFDRFMEIIEKQPDADVLAQYIRDNIHFCDGCAANVSSRAKEKEKKKCGYYYINIRGKKVLSCFGSSIGTSHYSRPKRELNDVDIKMMKRLLDVRCEQILLCI